MIPSDIIFCTIVIESLHMPTIEDEARRGEVEAGGNQFALLESIPQTEEGLVAFERVMSFLEDIRTLRFYQNDTNSLINIIL